MEDPQAYIESGILEQYALGLLTPAERVAVEAEAARHPLVAEELAAGQRALEYYAEAHSRELPAAMRDRVLTKVLAQITPAAAEAPVAAPVAATAGAPTPSASLRADVDALARPQAAAEPGVRSISSAAAPTAPRRGLAIAASIALLLSLFGNAYLYQQWQGADTALVALQDTQNRVAANTLVVEKKLGEVKEQNAVLRDAEFHFVALAGTPDAPQDRARVLFNAKTKQVYVDVQKLSPAPTGRQYQLWALNNGKPVDAGMLTQAAASGERLERMKDIASAQAFAVTLEPLGGSASPTMPIQAMGTI
ncbi:anti-sigma factor domain-containing protein [Hymenobacter nivis]|uniref:Anti-sigma factor n=1 Tax=Hymenobacter nivis TaxID=1850093 RepID=A0A502GMQ1_9BACT|nr:anti-sigma factor [Hymenobacter nivis]TPG63597.1 anti-sigma factor [Hymenobacter nivis]